MTRVNILLFVVSLLSLTDVFAQTFNDGPVEIRVRLQDIDVQYNQSTSSDFNLQVGSLPLSNFSDDELTIKVWVQDQANLDGAGWLGGTCLQPGLPMTGGSGTTQNYNDVLLNFTYPTAVPQYFDVRVDAWEDDVTADFGLISGLTPCGTNGSRCTFESSVCCVNLFGCLFSEGDDFRCDANPYFQGLTYRNDISTNNAIPPCAWYNHGYINANGNSCSNDFYHPRFETYWRYTRGTNCTPADAIDLGNLTSTAALTNFNSSICYSNNFTSTGAAGNDVFYRFNVPSAIGASISLTASCPVIATFNTKLYLLNSNCTVIDSATGTCGSAAIINKPLCDVGDYYVVVDGATASDNGVFTLSIAENTSFTLSASTTGTNVSCNGGSDGEAVVAGSGGVPPYTYSWGGSFPADSNITGLPAGSYTAVITDSEGCTASSTIQITEPAVLTVTATAQDASCGGANDGSLTATPTGGTSPYVYAWNTAPAQGSQTAVLVAPGTYAVVVTDANGCTATAQATVGQSTNVSLTVNSLDNVSCNGANDGSIDIELTGGVAPYAYSWSNSLPATQDQSGLAPGNYGVTVTDDDGCTVSGSYIITEPTALQTTVSVVQDALCFNTEDGSADIEVLGGTPPYSYNWSNGSSLGGLFDVAAGSYNVTVTDDNGCIVVDSVTISAPGTAVTSIISKTNADCSQSLTGTAKVTVSGGAAPYEYFWSNFETTDSISGLDAGAYTVIIEDNNGCSIIDTVTILELSAVPCESTNDTLFDTTNTVVPWFIPNVFTPNGDGNNDIFEIFVREPANAEVHIFNRNGSKVYFNANQTSGTGWDGTFDGNDAQEGTYVYMINLDFVDEAEEDRRLSGSITLLR